LNFYVGLVLGGIIGVLLPFGLPSLVSWIKKNSEWRKNKEVIDG